MNRDNSGNKLRLDALARILITSLVFLSMATVTLAGDKSSKDAAARAQALALFQKALAVSDIRAPGSPPFELQGTIDVHGGRITDAHGTYLLKWAAPDKWREEIHMPNYARIRIGGKNQYWQLRSTPDYDMPPVLELDQALGFVKELHVWSRPQAIADLKTLKLRQGRGEQIKAECATLISKDPEVGREYCFDPDSGMLLGDKRHLGQFSDFSQFAGKLFPEKVLIAQDSSPQIMFAVNSISTLGSEDPNDFVPSAGAASWPFCDDPDRLPRLIQQARPTYPPIARLAHIDGVVVAYGVIGTDGSIHNLKVFSSPSIYLVQSSLLAWEKLRYAPETCHGTPVPMETFIETSYRIGD